MAEFLPYSGLEAKWEITWHSGLTIASNARNGIEMRAPSRLRNCKSSKKSPSDAKRSGIKAMSSRRGSETDQNPEGSIEARGALRAICELGSSSSEHLSASIAMAPECQGLGCGQSHWARRADRNPHKGVRSRARFWPVGGHGIPVRIDQPSAAIAIPSLGIFDAPESIRRFSISAGLRKTKCRDLP